MSQPKPPRRPFLTTPATSGSSFSPLSTPQATSGTLGHHFSDSSHPSPPKNASVSMDKVHARMRRLGVPPRIYKKYRPLIYDKLCYAIGHDLDLEFPIGCGPIIYARLIVNERFSKGKQFQAIYSVGGDELTMNEEALNKGIEPFDSYVSKHLPEYGVNSANVYVVFHDHRHRNLEPFYRLQTCGNCFLHAPILMHWYAQLWYDPGKRAEDVNLIHLSRYLRNAKSGKELYDVVFRDKGGYSDTELKNLAGHQVWAAAYGEDSYESIRGYLEEHGPGMVAMEKTHKDLQENPDEGKSLGMQWC